MDFEWMISNTCNLKFSNIYYYSYRNFLLKRWGNGTSSSSSSVDISKNIELTQFKYKNFKTFEKKFELSTGVYSRLQLKLYFGSTFSKGRIYEVFFVGFVHCIHYFC